MLRLKVASTYQTRLLHKKGTRNGTVAPGLAPSLAFPKMNNLIDVLDRSPPSTDSADVTEKSAVSWARYYMII